MKAMKDENGNVIKNAHLVGTLRRLLKLLHNRIYPIFVFDGATPSLKINTVKSRRVTREREVCDYSFGTISD
jgi:DNA excision repair protein ERCC-5